MFSLLEKGLCFGPLKGFGGGVIAEEGQTTDRNFVPIEGTRIKIRVNQHPVGGAANCSLICEWTDDDTGIKSRPATFVVDISEGGGFFGWSEGPGSIAFHHESSQPAK